MLECSKAGYYLQDIPLSRYQEVLSLIEEDIYQAFESQTAVQKRDSLGGTGFAQIRQELLVQKYSYFRYKAFVNGILRNALRYENLKNVDIKDETERLSTVYSHNSYITENLTECYGYEICEKILKANNEKPLLHVRVNKLKISAVDRKSVV